VAEARIRHAKRYECLMAGEDYDILMRSVRCGLAAVEQAMSDAAFIVDRDGRKS
jgi:hypothetical protein